MAQSTLQKVAVKMNLNNGTDPETGNVRTVSVSLGSMSVTGYDADKALAVIDKIENCLTKSIYNVSEVRTSTLRKDS